MGWGSGSRDKKTWKERKSDARMKKFENCKNCNTNRGRFCSRHFPEAKEAAKQFRGAPPISLYDEEGRNLNGLRYDENGKRIWD